MAVAALCLLLLASSPGSPAIVGELIVIALATGLGSALCALARGPIPTNNAQEMTSEMIEMRNMMNAFEEQSKKQREVARADMVRNVAQFGLQVDKWWRDRKHQSEMHQKAKEFQRKMQERDDAYQKDMQEQDMAHESKLFLTKMCDQWVSIICKVCGMLTLAYLLRYLLVPGPARAIEMPVPGHAWVIANP